MQLNARRPVENGPGSSLRAATPAHEKSAVTRDSALFELCGSTCSQASDQRRRLIAASPARPSSTVAPGPGTVKN
jgi:hypothetical protein